MRNEWQTTLFKELFHIMFYVYYLQSISSSNKTYVGFTHNMKQRLLEHNTGKSIYTAQFMPWKIIGFFGFDQEEKARKFERYLKTNAGKIFLNRHFNNQP